MKLNILLPIILAFLFHLPAVTAGDWKILIPEDAISAEATAATELQAGLKKIFGVEFPIQKGEAPAPAIRIGQSPETARLLGNLDFRALKPDEIILKTVGKNLILTGDRPRGSLYAVYELLEREYGVRFWTAEVETWPTLKTFSLPQVDYQYAPPFFYREAFYDLILKSPVFAVKMRNNGHHDNIPAAWGGHLELPGWCHTFEQFVPAKKFFASHPEWFAEQNGKRIPYGQLCLTNPEVRKQLTDSVLAEMRKHPDARIVSVSQNDNQLFCRCKSCEAFVKKYGNQSDLLIDTVNHVADAVAKEFPQVQVETLAYNYTRGVPQTVHPRNNVIVRLCSIECDYSAPLDSPANNAFATEVREWSHVAKELYIWNYVTNFTKFYLPHPNRKNLAPDLRFFAANGVRSVFEQGSVGPGSIADFADLRAYLTSKLLWDPSLDAEKVSREFVNGYYGPAAADIWRYLEQLDSSISPGSKLSCYNNTVFWLDGSRLLELWSIMEEARRKAADSPKFLRRVEEAAVSINLTLLEYPEIWRNAPQLAGVSWRKLMERQLEVAERAGVKKFTEHAAVSGYDTLRTRIMIKHAVSSGTKPAVAGDRPWIGIPAVGQFRSSENHWSFVEKDAEAENGTALRMPNTHNQWASQARDLPDGTYDVYIEIRCDGDHPAGNAATAGIYNSNTGKVIPFEIPSGEIAGKTYRTVKVGSTELSTYSSLFCAPVINSTVKNIWISRYILVKK